MNEPSQLKRVGTMRQYKAGGRLLFTRSYESQPEGVSAL